jgi:hypothetical protein
MKGESAARGTEPSAERKENHVMPKRRREGFTIIEILVVVGVIAVLIGLLLPALSGAQKRSRKNTELSFLRQVGFGWTMYANSYEDASLPGFLEKNVQTLWAVEWETPLHDVITDGQVSGPYTWRLMPFLDFNPEVLYHYTDSVEDLDFTDPAHVKHFAQHPAFGYNAYYVGGWWRELAIGGSTVSKPVFHDAEVAGSGGRPANVVATRVTHIKRPSEILTFCSTTPVTEGIMRSRDSFEGSHIAHAPTVGEDEHWTAKFGASVTGSGMQQGTAAGSIYEPFTFARSAVPIGRYTKLASVLYADGHTDTQTAGGLDDPRKWMSSADDKSFAHTMGSLVPPGFTFSFNGTP